MNYFLFKMRFLTPLHIGESESARSLETSQMSFCADTYFSALCHTALRAEGEEGIQKLYHLVKNNHLFFSDALPYQNNDLYIPKPFALSKKYFAISRDEQKEMKKLKYLPIRNISDFCASIQGEKLFSAKEVSGNFGTHYVVDKVNLTNEEETELYCVGLFSFYEKSGLYLIIGYEEEKDLEYIRRLNRLMGFGGIGGKVTAGYGKFEIVAEHYLADATDESSKLLIRLLQYKKAKNYISLTASLPKEEELEEAMEKSSYGLIRRGGFVQSERYSNTLIKKRTQYFFCSGSVFLKPFEGEVYDIAQKENHPVYRYAKPIFLGVDL